MPRYKNANINYIVKRNDVIKLVKASGRIRNQALVVILWMTGARPGEIVELKRSDVSISDTKIRMDIVTKKKRKNKWHLEKRPLIYKRPYPRDGLIELVVKYISTVPEEARVFKISTRMVEIVIEGLGQKTGLSICPYNFRHSRFTTMSQQGATIDELMHMKGTTDIKSISPYLHAKPFKVKKL